MGKKKRAVASLKQCENIHVFMKNWYGVKSHNRKRTRFHHNDMALYLLNRGIVAPRSITVTEALKRNDDSVIFVRDDENNIRCYENKYSINKEYLLSQLSKKTDKQLEIRRKILQNEGYDYDPCTGEVITIEELEYLDWIYNLEPTEKVNRHGRQKTRL